MLGLAGRPAIGQARPSRRRAEASGYEAPADAVNPLQFGRAYQLPPFGRGNGLDALFWTSLARVPADRAQPVLDALAQAGIPGWAVPVRPVVGSRARFEPPAEDLWAAAAEAEQALDVVMRALSLPAPDPDRGVAG